MSARKYSNEDLAIMKKDGLAAQLPEPPVRKKRKNEESVMQRAVIAWWADYSSKRGIPECLLFAIPNGSALGHGKEEYQVKQRQIRGKIMKLEGLRPGCPDLMLAVAMSLVVEKGPPIPPAMFGELKKQPMYSGLFVEMKTAKGVVSDEQKEFIHALRNQGYQVNVCRSVEEAIEVIKAYLA